MPHRTDRFTATRWTRWTPVLLALHVLAGAGILWLFAPQPERGLQRIEGVAAHHKTCGRMCDEGIFIGGTLVACVAYWLGPRYACPQTFRAGAPAAVTYFEMRTALSALGISHPTKVAVRVEQGGNPLFLRGPDDVRDVYLWSAWDLYLPLLGSFFAFNHRLARRRDA